MGLAQYKKTQSAKHTDTPDSERSEENPLVTADEVKKVIHAGQQGEKTESGNRKVKTRDKIKGKTVFRKENQHEKSLKKSDTKVAEILNLAPDQKFTTHVKPMLATLVEQPFDDPGWEYEIKWDGYRAMAFIHNGKAELNSRNNISFNDRFYPVHKALSYWKVNAIVDGEIVVVNDKGISNFGSLQNWRNEADGELLFYVFDILWLDGKNLTEIPLTERKLILESIMPEEGILKSGYSVVSEGSDFFEAARKLGLEGIMAKRSDSFYFPGSRSKDWLKIKVNKRQEVVIAGYTRNTGTSKLFSSLLLGVYDQDDFVYVGKVGTGFKDQQQKDMLDIFKPLIVQESPFSAIPDYNKPSRFRPRPPKVNAIWLRPVMVCEVSFTEVTSDGLFRHPSFEGLREDKNAHEVFMETQENQEKVRNKI